MDDDTPMQGGKGAPPITDKCATCDGRGYTFSEDSAGTNVHNCTACGGTGIGPRATSADGIEAAFDAWFTEPEGFALRAERFDGDVAWLKAAFEAGRASQGEVTADNLVKRLRGTVEHKGGLGSLCDEAASALARVEALTAERDALHAAMVKISAIRDSIVGFQNVGWSEHIYPLVAALQEAGFEGIGYDKARENTKTLLAENASLSTRLQEAVKALERADQVGDVRIPTERGKPSVPLREILPEDFDAIRRAIKGEQT